MRKEDETLAYIAGQTAKYNDVQLTGVLMRTFEFVHAHRISDGCMFISAALHIVLRSLGYDPKFCYGLCVSPGRNSYYHAWLELDRKILDIPIYGNSYFSVYWLDEPVGPFVFENSDKLPVQYRNHFLDDDWEGCGIAGAIKMGSLSKYVEMAPKGADQPCNSIWLFVFHTLMS